MVKASNAAGDAVSDAAETVEAAVKNGTEALKASFEKAVENYDRLLGFGKETVEAYTQVVSAAGKGAETLHNELYAYSKAAVEETLANTTKLFGTKSVYEAFELQNDIARSVFEAYVSEVTKVSEIFVTATKETFEPLQGRVQALVDAVQAAHAA